MFPVAALLCFTVVPLIGYACSKVFEPFKRTGAFTVLAVLILALPAIDSGSSLRWWESILSFGILLKTVGLAFSGLVASGRVALDRFLWGLGKCCLVFVTLIVNTLAPSVLQQFWMQMITANLVVMWGISGAVDAHAGVFMLLTGKWLPPFSDSPLLSCSPRDFWSRRWNLLFKETAHKVLFGPLRSRGIPAVVGAIIVFAVSSILHEYMVFISRPDRTDLLGSMTLFFLAHSVATVVEAVVVKPLIASLPVALRKRHFGVVLTWIWMIAMSPLFFLPALECIPFMSWRLW